MLSENNFSKYPHLKPISLPDTYNRKPPPNTLVFRFQVFLGNAFACL
jgi:hypothetical protein